MQIKIKKVNGQFHLSRDEEINPIIISSLKELFKCITIIHTDYEVPAETEVDERIRLIG